jgi:hypothetical protein
MKIVFSLLFLLTAWTLFSQQNIAFDPGATLLENKSFETYETPQSILFIFSGHSHSINYFLDLEKKIKKVFRKKKSRKIHLDFYYDLNAKNSLESDLEKIPKKKYDKNRYDLSCSLRLSDFKSWDHDLIKKRKIQYSVIGEISSNKLEVLKFFRIHVNAYFMISTQNKDVSKLIHQLIME